MRVSSIRDNNLPLISVITTVLNNVDYIENTIMSIINQTYANIEYIVIDAGSTDGTLDIIKKYDDKIDIWITEPDEGIYYGMDKGIRMCSGEYFCILSSDDYYVNNTVIERIVSNIKEGSYDFYYGDAYIVHRESGRIKKKSNSKLNNIFYNSIPHPTIFLKKDTYIELGGYDMTYKVAADYEMTIKVIVHGKTIKKINDAYVFVRNGGYSSRTSLQIAEGYNVRKKYKLINPVVNYLIYLYKKHKSCVLKLIK